MTLQSRRGNKSERGSWQRGDFGRPYVWRLGRSRRVQDAAMSPQANVRVSGPLCWILLVASAVGATASSLANAPIASAASVQSATRATNNDGARVNPFRIGRTLVIPHGGGDGLFPENTLYAYEKSQALGGDVIDIDVFMAAHNVLIAMHDDTLDRTTNGTGRVSQTTYDAISKLDAGWNFKKNGKFPFRNKGITVPTIEAVLKRFPKTPATLDLKDLRVEAVAPICTLLRKLNRTSDVYVGVDTAEQVMAFRAACPEVSTSGTDAERRAMRAARDVKDATFVTKQLVGQPRFKADDGTKRITADYLAFSHSKGIAVLTWVVDDPKDMAELINLGVDGIYTRRPDVMVRVMKDLKKR
jgi:glycerophosphoryl diester phosphodiesterase